MAVEERVTFCRICEPLCGLVATVDDGRLTQLRPDRDHPLSQGYACPKGIAMEGVQNDPDRVVYPLRRSGGPGEFERVTWEEAMSDIAARLRRILAERGPEAVGWYMGNPGAFSYSHTLWAKGFLDGIGSPHYYSAGSQDVNNRFAASALLYGSPLLVPIPDLNRTHFLFMVGANPLVSHGSVLSAPRVREQLNDVVDRGGRVVVVDPRRTETARQYEHVAIRPDTDAWLLLSMLQVVFAEGLEDRGWLEHGGRGAETLADRVRDFDPERTEGITGVPAQTVRELARAFAATPGAAAYGRTGSCLGRFGTLVAYLLDALNAVTGNLDRPGGAVFGRPPIASGRGRREGGARHIWQGALAVRGLPRRDRQPAGDADPEGDHDPGRTPDPRVLRLRGQPGAVRARRRRARGGIQRARSAGVPRLLRDRHQPARRLHPSHHHVPRAGGRPGRADGFLQHSVHAGDAGGRARREAARVRNGASSRTSPGGSGSRPIR